MAQPGRRPPLPKDARRIPVPAAALEQWLAEIDDPGELKVTLRVVVMLAVEPTRGGTPPSLSLDDLLDDGALRRATELGNDGTIRRALAAALSRETLLAIRTGGEYRIWINDERAREYLEKAGLTPLEPSDITGLGADQAPAPLGAMSATPLRSNIIALYEQHIGTFGHSMAEQLREADNDYPAAWIEYAFSIAAEHKARSWSYVETILRRLVREGLPDRMVNSNEHGESGNDPEANRRAKFLDSYRRRHGRLPWEFDNTIDRNQNE
ncbi:MAG: hypothetical protein F4X64_10870 [Chloroflexi bacterium]|nr:hypothetical protein [Chloroflexota bacterium]